MIRAACRKAKVLGLAFLFLACHHEADVLPAAPPPAGDLPPTAPDASSPPDTGAAAFDDAAVPDAAPSVEAQPKVSAPDMSAAPAYPPSAVYEAFSKSKQKLIACYLPGKARDSKLRGKVIVKFTVNANGTVKPVSNEGSTLQDDDVIACVVRTVKTMHFTKPLEGSVTIIYPLIFRPTGDETLILPDAGKKP
jgi:TonB family protein